MAVDAIHELIECGRLGEAAARLDSLRSRTLTQTVLLTFLQADVADPHAAAASARELLNRHLSHEDRALCLAAIGKIAAKSGRVDEGCRLLRDALGLATKAKSARLIARIHSLLTSAVLHWVSIDSAVAELPRLRKFACTAGDTKSLVDFHLFSAEVDMRQGRYYPALRHLEIGEKLSTSVNDVLSAGSVFRMRANAALLWHSPVEGLRYGRIAVECSEQSGSLASLFASLSTLGHVAITVNLPDLAEMTAKRMLAIQFSESSRLAATDILMRAAVKRGDLASAQRFAAQIKKPTEIGSAYYWLSHLITRAKWLLAEERIDEGLSMVREAIADVRNTGDRKLLEEYGFLETQLLCAAGDNNAAAKLLVATVADVSPLTLARAAELNRLVGEILSVHADERTCFLSRAQQIETVALGVRTPPTVFHIPTESPVGPLHAVASLFTLSSNGELFAHEVMRLLDWSGAVSYAELREEYKGVTSIQVTIGSGTPRSEGNSSVIELGQRDGKKHSIFVTPRTDPRSWLAILALQQLCNFTRLRETDQSATTMDNGWWSNGTEGPFGMVVGVDTMTELLNTTCRVGASTALVLFTGETGTGKELLARALHDASPRRDRPFIPFNCTAVSREMLDSQLFGYRRGAFTGALEAFQGVIRAASGGTLFLDEIGEMPLDVQPKLLRFLESGEIHPLGEPQPIAVDVRVVAATNANLEQLVADGKFREDLFYRLNVVRLQVPPLRERREEIPLLAQHYIDKFSRESQKTGLRLAEETMEYLVLFKWPGNVRQLANEIRRMVALAESGAVLMPEHLSQPIASSRRTIPVSQREIAPTEFVVRMDQPMSAAIEHVERSMIQYAMKLADGRVEDAAQLLGLSRKGLYLKRQRLRMDEAVDEESTERRKLG
jgi:DNA-binding NtrC family response regulator/tetratricopeptide (TPR) repeat protein